MPDGHVHNYAHMTNFRKFAPLDLLSFFSDFFSLSKKHLLIHTVPVSGWRVCPLTVKREKEYRPNLSLVALAYQLSKFGKETKIASFLTRKGKMANFQLYYVIRTNSLTFIVVT